MPGAEYYEKFVASGMTSLHGGSPDKYSKLKEEKKHEEQESKIGNSTQNTSNLSKSQTKSSNVYSS